MSGTYWSNVEIVAGVIQRVYEDATQTVLDFQAAEEILSALRKAGWMQAQDVAVLVAAAGGRIEVNERLMIDPPTLWRSWYDPATDSTIIEAS